MSCSRLNDSTAEALNKSSKAISSSISCVSAWSTKSPCAGFLAGASFCRRPNGVEGASSSGVPTLRRACSSSTANMSPWAPAKRRSRASACAFRSSAESRKALGRLSTLNLSGSGKSVGGSSTATSSSGEGVLRDLPGNMSTRA